MGLEEVKSEILEDARKKADEIVEEAEEEKQRIIEEAEEKAEKISKKAKEELEDEKESYRRRTISNARMEAKEEKLEAREENLSRVFEEFREKLEEMTDKEKEKYVGSCLEKPEFEIGKVIGGQEFEEFVSEEFEEQDVNGVIVVSEDGTRRQNFCFDKIVEQYKNLYRKQVAEKLFK